MRLADPAPSTDRLAQPRRRQLLKAAVGGAAAACSLPLLAAGPGYEISRWRGPVGDFKLVDTTGRTWSPDDLAGRAVLLNFWATWCEPCRAEMPALQRLAQQESASRLLVLAINFKETASRAIRFAESTGLKLPLLLDTDGRFAATHEVRVFPTTLLLDARGQPQQRVKGEFDWQGPLAARLIAPLMIERT